MEKGRSFFPADPGQADDIDDDRPADTEKLTLWKHRFQRSDIHRY